MHGIELVHQRHVYTPGSSLMPKREWWRECVLASEGAGVASRLKDDDSVGLSMPALAGEVKEVADPLGAEGLKKS